MSGRPWPESLEMLDCTSKSTRSMRPAASTTLRSCVSPQTPRVLLERSADASDSAVERSRSSDSAARFSCWVSSPCWRLRCDSSSVTFDCISVSDCLHRGERLEHLALGLLARLARLLLGAVLLDELAVLLLRRRGSARAAPRRWPAWRRAPRGAATWRPPRPPAPRRAAPGGGPRRARGRRRPALLGCRTALQRAAATARRAEQRRRRRGR